VSGDSCNYVVAKNAEEPQARRAVIGCAQQQQRRPTRY